MIKHFWKTRHSFNKVGQEISKLLLKIKEGKDDNNLPEDIVNFVLLLHKYEECRIEAEISAINFNNLYKEKLMVKK